MSRCTEKDGIQLLPQNLAQYLKNNQKKINMAAILCLLKVFLAFSKWVVKVKNVSLS